MVHNSFFKWYAVLELRNPFISAPPITGLENDSALELSYQGPSPNLTVHDVNPNLHVLKDAALWEKGKPFIWYGRFGLESSVIQADYEVSSDSVGKKQSVKNGQRAYAEWS